MPAWVMGSSKALQCECISTRQACLCSSLRLEFAQRQLLQHYHSCKGMWGGAERLLDWHRFSGFF